MRAVALDHVVLEVRDPEASLRFYVDGLGLVAERAEAFRDGKVPFVSVRAGAGLIDLFSAEAPGAGPNHLCLEVDASPTELTEVLDRQGISFEGAGRRYGARGDGFSVYVRDPDGHRVEVRTYRPDA